MTPLDGRLTPRERLLAATIEYFAENGIGDTTLRGLAAAVGTSHRMLIYHFGSREGLLAEVVRVVEAQQRESLAALAAEPGGPEGMEGSGASMLERSMRYWELVTAEALKYGRLFFELSAHAMQGKPHTEDLRADLIGMWLPPLTDLFIAIGVPESEAPARARLGLAASRGLMFDLLITGDRDGVEEAALLMNRLLIPSPS